MEKSCDICGTAFEAKMVSQKRCSSKCRKVSRRNWMFERHGVKSWRKIINCSICNKPFMPKTHNGIICSKLCKNEQAKLKMREVALNKVRHVNNVLCITCGEAFSTVGKSKVITCSKVCSIKNKKRDASNRPYRKEIKYKLYQRLRNAINWRIKANLKTSEVCNYTTQQLKVHLEAQFCNHMNWSNYGVFGWHIDHIKPLSAFNFFDKDGNIIIEEVREAMSLENLQPLWREDNLKKGGIKKIKANN